MQIRLATFNCENLFARYRFRQGRESRADDGFAINDLAFDLYDETAKQLTAQAIKQADADIICLQEIENIHVLERFNSRYLASMRYKYRMLVDSHDPRFIDVAILSRYPIGSVISYRHDRNARNTAWLFSRDCLEADIQIGDAVLTVYVNHFKSMIGGRDNTYDRRMEQTERVADIITKRWQKVNYEGNFAILGDFNDYIDAESSLLPLINHEGLINPTDALPEQERWTHFWSGGNEYRQLDFLLISPFVAAHENCKPQIIRHGMPYRAEQYTGERFDGVGENDPKASDHAPLVLTLNLETGALPVR